MSGSGASGHTILMKNMRRTRTQSLYTRGSHISVHSSAALGMHAGSRDDAEQRGEDCEGEPGVESHAGGSRRRE